MNMILMLTQMETFRVNKTLGSGYGAFILTDTEADTEIDKKWLV